MSSLLLDQVESESHPQPSAGSLDPDGRRPPAAETILCVDDELNILNAFKRQFHKQFRIEIALGPEMGLDAIVNRGPFAVVVSDLRMPVMDGIQFLAAVRARCPDTVRVMLTGQADLTAAIAAVNQGSIFRFLLKPCPEAVFSRVIESALEQYRLVTAERQLTRETLVGCVTVLMEILSLTQPAISSRAMRLRRYVQHMSAKAAHRNSNWKFEAAAMLSQIGWISLPSEIIDKVVNRQELTADEQARFVSHPAAAASLLSHIPRLEAVIAMIGGQFERFANWEPQGAAHEEIALGAQLLRIASDFDSHLQNGQSCADALLRMRIRAGDYNPELLSALAGMDPSELFGQVRTVRFRDLARNMVLDEDLVSRKGTCLLGKGQEITGIMLQRLAGFAHLVAADTTVRVRVRSGSDGDEIESGLL